MRKLGCAQMGLEANAGTAIATDQRSDPNPSGLMFVKQRHDIPRKMHMRRGKEKDKIQERKSR